MRKSKKKQPNQRGSKERDTYSSALFTQTGQKRVEVEYVGPQVEGDKLPIKRVLGETVAVTAHIFSDGHDKIQAELLYRTEGEKTFKTSKMSCLVNDEWKAVFEITELKTYYYTVRAWLDRFGTWQDNLRKKVKAGQKVDVDLIIGSELI